MDYSITATQLVKTLLAQLSTQRWQLVAELHSSPLLD